MKIRKAEKKDIPRILALLGQVLQWGLSLWEYWNSSAPT